MATRLSTSDYINQERRLYSLYVLHNRALPCLADGLKASARRLMWMARDGKRYKTATLAGITMAIHPHAEASNSANTITGPYTNNIPLFKGEGAFGTLLKPTAYGAARYTEVQLSDFTKDAVLTDIELIPMKDNYDGTQQEPAHFIPLVPLSIVNPNEGIAVGFACNILPRKLTEIIEDQITVLNKGKVVEERLPYSKPYDNVGYNEDDRYAFYGEFERKKNVLHVTKLPYGMLHEKFIVHLIKLIDEDVIVDYVDKSRDYINIEVKFKRGALTGVSDDEIISMLKLKNNVSENMNVLSFDGDKVLNLTYQQTITDFTNWRLSWYRKRYERLKGEVATEMQRYVDIVTAYDNNIDSMLKKIKSRSEMKEFVTLIGVVNVDYITQLPMYFFTQDEITKIKGQIADCQALIAKYDAIINSDSKQRKIYKDELSQISKKYG